MSVRRDPAYSFAWVDDQPEELPLADDVVLEDLPPWDGETIPECPTEDDELLQIEWDSVPDYSGECG